MGEEGESKKRSRWVDQESSDEDLSTNAQSVGHKKDRKLKKKVSRQSQGFDPNALPPLNAEEEGPIYGPYRPSQGEAHLNEVPTQLESSSPVKGGATSSRRTKYVPVPQFAQKPRSFHPINIQACRSVECYEKLNRIDEGAYGIVYRAKDKKTGEIVALKRLKLDQEHHGFPVTALREIHTLLRSQHPHIIHVREIVVGNSLSRYPFGLYFNVGALRMHLATGIRPPTTNLQACI
jgi:hypothetical protein